MISSEVLSELNEFFDQWNKSLLKRIGDKKDGFSGYTPAGDMFQAILETKRLIIEILKKMNPLEFTNKVEMMVKEIENDSNTFYGAGKRDDISTSYRQKINQELNALVTFIRLFQDVVTNLESSLNVPNFISKENTRRFSLLLYSEKSIKDFAIDLLAMDMIYTELTLLTKVSKLDNPLKIIKIESGSFWIDVLGYPKIIDVMKNMIESSANYFYRHFTLEGKIVSIPQNVESLESIINLRKQLKAIGVNTAELDETINKSAVIISRQLNNLLLREAKIKVDGKILCVGQELEQKYLEQTKTLMLPDHVNASDKS